MPKNPLDPFLLSLGWNEFFQLLFVPKFLEIDAAEKYAYVSDEVSNNFLRINLADGSRSIVKSGIDSKYGQGPFLNASEDKVYSCGSDKISMTDLTTNAEKTLVRTHSIYACDIRSSAWIAGIYGLITKIDLASLAQKEISSGTTASGPQFFQPSSVAVSADESYALVTDFGNGGSIPPGIYKVNLVTGMRSLIASSSVGTGTQVVWPMAITLDKLEQFAYYFESKSQSVVKLDLSTRSRVTILDSTTKGVGSITSLKLSADNKFLYLVNQKQRTLFKWSFATSALSEVYRSKMGEGPSFLSPKGIGVNSQESKAYIADIGAKSIVEVNFSTALRKTISNSVIGSGAKLQGPIKIFVTKDDTIALVLDSVANALFKVNLISGDRTILSSSTVGTGTHLNKPTEMVVNSAETIAYVYNDNSREILSINLQNGLRTRVSDTLLGKGGAGGNSYDMNRITSMNLNPAENSLYITWWVNDLNYVDYKYYGTLNLTTKEKVIIDTGYNSKGDFVQELTEAALSTIDPNKLYVTSSIDMFNRGSAGIYEFSLSDHYTRKKVSLHLYDISDFVKSKKSDVFYLIDQRTGAVLKADPNASSTADVLSMP